jgi:hypothetical protein
MKVLIGALTESLQGIRGTHRLFALLHDPYIAFEDASIFQSIKILLFPGQSQSTSPALLCEPNHDTRQTKINSTQRGNPRMWTDPMTVFNKPASKPNSTAAEPSVYGSSRIVEQRILDM